MKKKISLPVMAVSAILLLGGCGTQMYDLSEDEENLVVQYSAHILAKYNIEQKDGMTAASSEETQETQKQDITRSWRIISSMKRFRHRIEMSSCFWPGRMKSSGLSEGVWHMAQGFPMQPDGCWRSLPVIAAIEGG